MSGVESLGGQCPKMGQDGWPDRLAILPGGLLIWVETKRPDGKHDPLQRWRAATLRRLGQRVEIPWSKDDVERLLREWEEEIKRNTADR